MGGATYLPPTFILGLYLTCSSEGLVHAVTFFMG